MASMDIKKNGDILVETSQEPRSMRKKLRFGKTASINFII
jgi:hypothetical protein